MCVTTLESTFEGPRRIADIEVEGVNGVELTLNNAIFGNIIASEDDVPPSDADVAGMAHLEGVKFPSFPEKRENEVDDGEETSIGAIIGASHAQLWTTGEKRHGGAGLPIGVETGIGWGLLGPKNCSNFAASCHLLSFQPYRDEINENIEI